ncbi:MAG TPA: HAD-IIIA family hydrolase, partial [bacterium]|nr:HAD-IIIA family hydrolase [bacterium]
VDGVLTDGGLYYSDAGLQMKRFHSRDGLGIKLLLVGGIEVALLTGDTSPIAVTRAKRLEIPHALLGVEDKLEALRDLATRLGLDLSQVAYMGDDLNDLGCLVASGFGACPADAAPEVRGAATYVCGLPGGAGCVREVCDLIRHAQQLPVPTALQGPTVEEPAVDVAFNPTP